MKMTRKDRALNFLKLFSLSSVDLDSVLVPNKQLLGPEGPSSSLTGIADLNNLCRKHGIGVILSRVGLNILIIKHSHALPDVLKNDHYLWTDSSSIPFSVANSCDQFLQGLSHFCTVSPGDSPNERLIQYTCSTEEFLVRVEERCRIMEYTHLYPHPDRATTSAHLISITSFDEGWSMDIDCIGKVTVRIEWIAGVEEKSKPTKPEFKKKPLGKVAKKTVAKKHPKAKYEDELEDDEDEDEDEG